MTFFVSNNNMTDELRREIAGVQAAVQSIQMACSQHRKAISGIQQRLAELETRVLLSSHKKDDGPHRAA